MRTRSFEKRPPCTTPRPKEEVSQPSPPISQRQPELLWRGTAVGFLVGVLGVVVGTTVLAGPEAGPVALFGGLGLIGLPISAIWLTLRHHAWRERPALGFAVEGATLLLLLGVGLLVVSSDGRPAAEVVERALGFSVSWGAGWWMFAVVLTRLRLPLHAQQPLVAALVIVLTTSVLWSDRLLGTVEDDPAFQTVATTMIDTSTYVDWVGRVLGLDPFRVGTMYQNAGGPPRSRLGDYVGTFPPISSNDPPWPGWRWSLPIVPLFLLSLLLPAPTAPSEPRSTHPESLRQPGGGKDPDRNETSSPPTAEKDQDQQRVEDRNSQDHPRDQADRPPRSSLELRDDADREDPEIEQDGR